DRRVEMQRVSQLGGHGLWQAIIAPFDAPLRFRTGRFGGELFDQHEQREVFGIGKEEAAEAAYYRAHVPIGVDFIEPLRDGSLGDASDDRAFPLLLGPPIGFDQRFGAVEDRLPGPLALHWTAVDLPSALGAHKGKPPPENRAHRETV